VNKLMTQIGGQHKQMSRLGSQLDIDNNDLDELKDQWSDRGTRFCALKADSTYLSIQGGLINLEYEMNNFMPTQSSDTLNTEVSTLNEIAEWEITFTALKNKLTDLQMDMNIVNLNAPEPR
jgi:hypothetical protein